MKLGRALSVGLVGLEATVVDVEVSIGGGLPRTVIVGLPDTALYEARDRCRAAVGNSALSWPAQAVTINLSPATLPKAGSHYDLAIAAAVLAADAVVPPGRLHQTVLLGELGLDGRVRAVRGVLPGVLAAQAAGCHHVIVPAGQVREARLVEGIAVVGVSCLADLVRVLRGERVPEPLVESGADADVKPAADPGAGVDLADVVGQLEARHALEVAAAGGHHLYLHGPPGVGKTLLAERLPGLLPDLSTSEALEVAALRSLCGHGLESGLVVRPPFSSPHHSASVAALVGGGPRIALPGAISMAHCGVLFLDEAPEFSQAALEALRTPLESGRIVLNRSRAQTTYPARFQLVLAANPCPCGRSGRPELVCACPPYAVRRYRERLSGPILDRIDIVQQVRPMTRSYLRAVGSKAESTASVAARVHEARARQAARWGPQGWSTNAQVPGPVLRGRWGAAGGEDLLDRAVARGLLSARGVDKVLRLAWTMADLDGATAPERRHVEAALAMRRGDDASEGVRCG